MSPHEAPLRESSPGGSYGTIPLRSVACLTSTAPGGVRLAGIVCPPVAGGVVGWFCSREALLAVRIRHVCAVSDPLTPLSATHGARTLVTALHATLQGTNGHEVNIPPRHVRSRQDRLVGCNLVGGFLWRPGLADVVPACLLCSIQSSVGRGDEVISATSALW
jgi:hypothetical protein